MAESIKSAVEEGEEEEEEGPVIDVHHRKLVYKVQSVPSPNRPITSSHLVSQSASKHSSNSSYSKSSSYMMKSEGITTQMSSNSGELTAGQPPFLDIVEQAISSPLDYTQESRVTNISTRAAEQYLPPENDHKGVYHEKNHHPEEAFISNDQFQQPHVLHGNLILPDQVGVSDDMQIITESNFNQKFGPSSGMSQHFEVSNPDVDSILHYDEMLHAGNSSGTQHAPLFGHAAEKLHTFPTSDFSLLGTNTVDNVNTMGTNEHNPKNHVIMGLTPDGQAIIGGLSIPIADESGTIEKIVSSALHAVNPGDEAFSMFISQIPKGLDGHHSDTEYANSNIITGGLTARHEFIIEGLTESSPEEVTKSSVLLGLTADGQVICGGCMLDSTPECISGVLETAIKSGENHATMDIIANVTAKNEKVLSGLSLESEISRPYSDFTTAVPECLFGISGTSTESGEQHAVLDIVANVTAENEKVLTGVSLKSDSLRPYSDSTTATPEYLNGISGTSTESGEHHAIIANVTAQNEQVLSGLTLTSDPPKQYSDSTTIYKTHGSDGAFLRRDSF